MLTCTLFLLYNIPQSTTLTAKIGKIPEIIKTYIRKYTLFNKNVNDNTGTPMKWYVCYDDEPQKRLVRLLGLSSLARHVGLRHMHEGEEGSRIVTIGLQQVLDVHEGGAFLQRLAGQVVDVLAAGLEAQVKALDVRSQVELLLVGTVRPDAQVEGSEVAVCVSSTR